MPTVLKRLEGISQCLIRLGAEMKQCVEDIRTVATKQQQQQEEELESAPLPNDDSKNDGDPEHHIDDVEIKKVRNYNIYNHRFHLASET